MPSIGQIWKQLREKKPEVHFVGGDDVEIDLVKEEGTGMYVVNLIRNIASGSLKDTRAKNLEGMPQSGKRKESRTVR